MSTISLATHIFQDLLFSLLFKCIFFFQNPHTGVPQSHHYPFKAIITSFQNASVLEHSQSTSWRVHFLTCHTCIFVLVKMDLELWTRFLKKNKTSDLHSISSYFIVSLLTCKNLDHSYSNLLYCCSITL